MNWSHCHWLSKYQCHDNGMQHRGLHPFLSHLWTWDSRALRGFCVCPGQGVTFHHSEKGEQVMKADGSLVKQVFFGKQVSSLSDWLVFGVCN